MGRVILRGQQERTSLDLEELSEEELSRISGLGIREYLSGEASLVHATRKQWTYNVSSPEFISVVEKSFESIGLPVVFSATHAFRHLQSPVEFSQADIIVKQHRYTSRPGQGILALVKNSFSTSKKLQQLLIEQNFFQVITNQNLFGKRVSRDFSTGVVQELFNSVTPPGTKVYVSGEVGANEVEAQRFFPKPKYLPRQSD